ncbi:MAG: 23S rRNA (adenine(2503)-C(2))-methyltransferase RlmN [Phycisphaerae bacterium]|nr:23S rRNA (adenine(2503)-C(2))-methyltransferase RlmN [Phycisphaerae bacterium]NUQ46034.1 23S rRNA (adenine(2503)-C(2))-methyltransferase RlmN [Phycisphaerae bacterium]
MNALELTFDDILSELKPRPGQIAAVRRAYAAAMRGETGPHALPADVLPVVREWRDGELIKFAQRTRDGLETESVVIPMQGTMRTWKTLCVSSQIGCAMGCTFCETAQLGRLSQLSAGQIVGQVVAARRHFGVDIRNVVFMGMGEPFDNFDEVIRSVRIMTDPAGLSLAKARIAISTVGRIEGIRRLAALGWRRINLAVSLNAPNDEIRSQIMPVNRVEPMAKLREALMAFPLRSKGGYLMIEYVLIPGVNDAPEHARELVEYLRPIKCCVNVIPYNPRRDSPWPAPSEESVGRFLGWLIDAGQFCKRRVTKGRDFMAACGQLGNRALVRARREAVVGGFLIHAASASAGAIPSREA